MQNSTEIDKVVVVSIFSSDKGCMEAVNYYEVALHISH